MWGSLHSPFFDLIWTQHVPSLVEQLRGTFQPSLLFFFLPLHDPRLHLLQHQQQGLVSGRLRHHRGEKGQLQKTTVWNGRSEIDLCVTLSWSRILKQQLLHKSLFIYQQIIQLRNMIQHLQYNEQHKLADLCLSLNSPASHIFRGTEALKVSDHDWSKAALNLKQHIVDFCIHDLRMASFGEANRSAALAS